MLSLTRPQRQALATVALMAFSVAPTAYVGLWAWSVNRPGHVRDVEIEAGRRLGLQVTLDGVRYPRPGEVVLRGVTLRQEAGGQPATLAEVARASQIRLRREGRQVIAEADGLRLRADGPRAAVTQLGALMMRTAGDGVDRVGLTARAVRVELGEGLGFDLANIAGQLDFAAGSTPALSASYQVVDGPTAARCELTLARASGPKGPITTLTFQTMEGTPPARVLGPFFDAPGWLGPSAKVEGTLTLTQAGAADWEARFQGELIDVDLAVVFADRFPGHRLGGRGRVSVATARWADRPGQGPGWVEASGTLSAGPGTISAGLLQALAAEMRFRLSPRADLRLADVGFEGLGLAFSLAPDGQLRLDGALGPEHAPGVVLVRGSQVDPLAFAPEGAANVRGLWKALFPADADVLVPLTAESQVLRYLPSPPAAIGQAAPSVRAN